MCNQCLQNVGLHSSMAIILIIPWRFNKMARALDTLLHTRSVELASFKLSKQEIRPSSKQRISLAGNDLFDVHRMTAGDIRVRSTRVRHVCVFKHVTGITMSPDTRCITDFTNAMYTRYEVHNLLIHIFRLKDLPFHFLRQQIFQRYRLRSL